MLFYKMCCSLSYKEIKIKLKVLSETQHILQEKIKIKKENSRCMYLSKGLKASRKQCLFRFFDKIVL